jgi:ubiquinone/menaquinone biosynthesis C-methylase UbiE
MIVSALELRGNEKVLEIGCGTGDALVEISTLIPNGTVLGLDHSSLMVKRAARKIQHQNNAEVQKADFSQFFAPPHSFDRVVLSNVHQFWRDPVEKFQQIAQLLNPHGGLTVAIRIHDPKDRSCFSKIGYDNARQQQLFEQLKQAGFNTRLQTQKKLTTMAVLLIHCS